MSQNLYIIVNVDAQHEWSLVTGFHPPYLRSEILLMQLLRRRLKITIFICRVQ